MTKAKHNPTAWLKVLLAAAAILLLAAGAALADTPNPDNPYWQENEVYAASSLSESEKAASRAAWNAFTALPASYSLWDTERAEASGVADVARQVAGGYSNAEDKIYAIAYYLCDNLYYDYDFFELVNPQTYYDPVDVLTYGYTTCSGFATTAQSMLQAVGVPCVTIIGYNHAYNAAWTGSRWLLFDTTWCCRSIYYQGVKTHYTPNMRDWHDFTLEYGLNDVDPNHNIVGMSIYIVNGVVRTFDTCATDIELDESITEIGDSAFQSSRNLTTITMPGVVTIDEKAFFDCKQLTEVNMPNVVTIGKRAFDTCESLLELNLPECTSIGEQAFFDCTSLQTVELPNALTIGKDAFNICTSLTTVDIPLATSIGGWAFEGCTALTTIDLTSAEEIGAHAFANCTNLVLTELPAVQSIDVRAFYRCTKLTEMDMPNVLTIGGFAFYSCTKLTTVTMPLVTQLDEQAFGLCILLTGVDLQEAVTVGDYCFYQDASLTYAYMPKAVTIGEYAFSTCRKLKTVTIPMVETIGRNAFYFNALQSIVLPATLTEIPTRCFYGCTSLATLEMTNSVTSVGDSAFTNCNALRTVKFKGTPEEAAAITIAAGNTALQNALWVYDTLTTMRLNDSICEIGEMAFMGIPVGRIVIPSGVTSIGAMAFANCANLEELVFEGNPTDIAADALSGCTGVTIYVSGPGNAATWAYNTGFDVVYS